MKEMQAYDQQKSIILRSEYLNLQSLVSVLIGTSPIIEEIKKILENGFFANNVRRQLELGETKDFEFKDDLLYFKGLYVPPIVVRLEVLQARNVFSSAKHFGYINT